MANEITLDPYDQAESEFSADELNSLEVGERLAAQENELLAGKYRSAEELERGYLELQKRLSGKEEEVETEQPEEAKEEEESEDQEVDLYDTIMESYRTGEWDPEVVSKVEGMSPVDVANMFLEKGGAQSQAPQATSGDIEQIQESVGGSTEYQNMIQWASQNLSEQEVQMYDTVMDRGDPIAMFFAAQALSARYQDAVGYDGEMLTGNAPRNSTDSFRSQAELVEAMSDPRYDRDPAYRADVADKLERSNINF